MLILKLQCRKKLRGSKFKTLGVICKENRSEDVNVIGGRFMHMLKNYLTSNETAKVKYVAQEHDCSLKCLPADSITALRLAPIKSILRNALHENMLMLSHDVTLTYIGYKDKSI